MGITNFFEETTKEFTGTITLNDATPDITSDTVTLYMYKKGSDDSITKSADVSLGSGQYKVTLDTTDTDVSPGNWDYEIWWVKDTGETYVLETGKVIIYDSQAKT